ncbi:MAG: cyclic nucleotide-binding domain-containing protein [Desulfobacteraceae bacterium]|nr:cyclic nucleotide-binding domain-containing protein [Desulfobacteraceae bacterium]
MFYGTDEAVSIKEAFEMPPADKLKESVDFLEKIKTLPVLEGFDENDLKELLRISKISRYAPGELIADENASSGWIYYLIAGRIRIAKKGVESAVLRRTGDVFGDMGPMGAGDRLGSVHALDETTCLKINVSKVDGLPSENRFVFRYAVFRSIAEVLAKRLSITTEKYLKAKEELERFRNTD